MGRRWSEAEKHRRQKTSVKRQNKNLENTQSTDTMIWWNDMTRIQSSSAWDLKAVCGSSTEGFDGRLNHPAMTLCLTYEGRFATLSVLIQVPHVCFAFTRIQFSDILNTMKSTAYILTNPGTSWIWGKTLKRFDSGHKPASAVLEGCSHLLFNN